jgi:hypothetical protein
MKNLNRRKPSTPRGYVVVASPKPLEIDTVIPQGGKSWALNGGFDAYSWRVIGHATREEMLEFGGKVLGLVEPMLSILLSNGGGRLTAALD